MNAKAFYAVAETLNAFYSGFGVPAYSEENVPAEEKEPYITYTVVCPGYLDAAPHQVRVWTRSESNVPVLELAGKVIGAIGLGVTLKAEGARGYVTLDPETPLMQMQPTDDPLLKVAYINLSLGAMIAPEEE